MQVKIYGYGWVGKAMHRLFPDALIVDPGLDKNAGGNADVAFICVPTPWTKTGVLDTSIVEDLVHNIPEKFIIIRSTLNPGTCDELEKHKKDIVFMPEYLGETISHPLIDDRQAQFLIIGGKPKNRRKAIELFWKAYNANIKIRQVTNLEAEVIKLSENRAIMFKVAQCQELYDACEKNGIDYYTVRDAVYGDDPRFNLWFTAIYPNKRGADSKCIPKDVYAWTEWAKRPPLTEAMLKYNRNLIDA